MKIQHLVSVSAFLKLSFLNDCIVQKVRDLEKERITLDMSCI